MFSVEKAYDRTSLLFDLVKENVLLISLLILVCLLFVPDHNCLLMFLNVYNQILDCHCALVFAFPFVVLLLYLFLLV